MTIIIVLFGVMTLFSMVVILSATLLASRTDKEWNDWKDLEEFERSLQEQPPHHAKPQSSPHDENKNDNSIGDSDMNTSPID